MQTFFHVMMLCGLLVATDVLADEGDNAAKADETRRSGAWTSGGKQFWSDYIVQDHWRVQRNVYTGHYRLLNADNRRQTWGTYGHCQREFNRLRIDGRIPSLKKEVVVTLHGMGRTRESMTGMGEYLAKECGFSLINVSYASTRDRIDSHARALASVVEHLEDVETVHFVAHSMGNLVLRRYLAMRMATEPVESSLPAVGRIVMLAPPNQGSSMAKRLRDNEVFRLVAGIGGAELAERWDEIEPNLKTPEGEFGIIAGGSGNPLLSNPVLTGDDDAVVTINETKLDQAADFCVVPVVHTLIMDDERVREYTQRFLQHGFFISEDKRNRLGKLEQEKTK
ncbi:MAG: alpha/beta fold hydrolase [Planctomycetota bacterium]